MRAIVWGFGPLRRSCRLATSDSKRALAPSSPQASPPPPAHGRWGGDQRGKHPLPIRPTSPHGERGGRGTDLPLPPQIAAGDRGGRRASRPSPASDSRRGESQGGAVPDQPTDQPLPAPPGGRGECQGGRAARIQANQPTKPLPPARGGGGAALSRQPGRTARESLHPIPFQINSEPPPITP
jgi:hypothetical protein